MAAAAFLAAALAGIAAPAGTAAATTSQPAGTIDTVAGGLGQGRATNVANDPRGGLMLDGGHLYVGDSTIAVVRDFDLGTGLETPMPTTFLGSNVPFTARDGSGNFYLYMGGRTGAQGTTEPVARYQCQVVKVAPGGAATVVAGNGTCGYSGDGGPATVAQLGNDGGTRLAFDPAGDLYIADERNNRVRKVDASGVITTVVGTGTQGYPVDGLPAALANLSFPGAMVFDPAGNLYLAEVGNDVVRRVDAATTVVTTVAGRPGGCSPASNFDGDGVATEHNLQCPGGLALDNAHHYLFISDYINNRVRRVDLAASPPTMVTVAGNGNIINGGVGGIGDGGPGTSASMRGPTNLAFDAATANLYIADTGFYRVRRLDPAGTITTAAGTGHGAFGGDGSPATSAQLENQLPGVASDGAGNLFFSDPLNFVVRRIDPAGVVTTVAGTATGTDNSGLSPDGGAATATVLDGLRGVAADASGLYIATYSFDCRIRRVANGVISTVAGSQGAPFASSCGDSGDGGPATSAKVEPGGLALDGAHHLYMGSDCSVRRIDLAASPPTISTVAGTGTCGYSGDGGPATSAQVNGAASVAVDGAGNFYLAPSSGCVVRKVNAAGIISTVAGSPICAYSSTGTGYQGDGGPATSAFVQPGGLAVDRAGANLYIADIGTARVRGVDLSSGTISTVAGSSVIERALLTSDFSGDGGPATSAKLAKPEGLALDGAGGLYIGDSVNSRLRKVVLAPYVAPPPSLQSPPPPPPPPSAAAGTTARMSVGSTGTQGVGLSSGASTSADGRYVAFTSNAGNLVPGDTYGNPDIFVRDRVAGTTTRVSVATSGAQADGGSTHPSISADGRYVAFDSFASNLVAGDANGASDVFVRDRVAGTTTRVSVNSAGAGLTGGDSARPSISADGRYVAFDSAAADLVVGDSNGATDVFVHDMATGATTRASVDSAGVQANGASSQPAISGNGMVVAFSSWATNLVTGDTNGAADVFVRDLATGATTRVSVNSAGAQATGSSTAPAVNSDGTVVAFASAATDLVAGDTNGVSDVFVANRTTGAVTRVSVDSGGAQANGPSAAPSVTADGRRVAFESAASNLVVGDSGSLDVFVHDNSGGDTARWSIGYDGAQANGNSSAPAMAADGSVMAFASTASNLVPGDTNDATDVFARKRAGPVDPATSTLSAAPASVPADGNTASTLTVTLKDKDGVRIPGKTVTLARTAGPGTPVISPASGVSDNAGVVSFAVTSATVATDTFAATDTTDSLSVAQVATVAFVAGPVSAAASTLVARPAAVPPDGVTPSTVTVTLLDAHGNPVTGKTVTLVKTSGAGTPVISSASGPSSAAGIVTFTVTSTTAATDTFTATDTTDSRTITQTATVAFTTSAVSAVNSTVSAQPVSVPANGSSASTVTVTVKNGAGKPVAGKTVSLNKTAGPGTPVINPASGTTNKSGVVTFTVTSTTVGTDTFTATDTTDPVVIKATTSVNFT